MQPYQPVRRPPILGWLGEVVGWMGWDGFGTQAIAKLDLKNLRVLDFLQQILIPFGVFFKAGQIADDGLKLPRIKLGFIFPVKNLVKAGFEGSMLERWASWSGGEGFLGGMQLMATRRNS